MAVCRNCFPLQIANVVYFQRKIQRSDIFAYPDGSPSQLIRISIEFYCMCLLISLFI